MKRLFLLLMILPTALAVVVTKPMVVVTDVDYPRAVLIDQEFEIIAYINNTGNLDANITSGELIFGSPGEWTWSCVGCSFVLEAGKNATLNFNVSAPSSPMTDQFRVRVNYTYNEYSEYYESRTYDISVLSEYGGGVDLELEPNTIEIELGEIGRVVGYVENTGVVTDTYIIELLGDPLETWMILGEHILGVDTCLIKGVEEMCLKNVDPGETRTIFLGIPGYEVGAGYSLTVSAESVSDPTVIDSDSVSVSIITAMGALGFRYAPGLELYSLLALLLLALVYLYLKRA